jgi:hypothetical protein
LLVKLLLAAHTIAVQRNNARLTSSVSLPSREV